MRTDGLSQRLQGRLVRGRAAAEARMVSRAVVRRKTGNMVPDGTGLKVPEWVVVHANLPFRVGGSEAGASGFRTVSVGGSQVQVALRTGHFPAATGNLADGDLVEVTSGENTGSVWRIVEATGADQQTARRVPVMAAQRPAEWPP